ncbi:unnamed protein product [Wickerhamomyces anomalus]
MSDIVVIRTVKELREWKRQIAGGSVGFIPTMGALHQGHLSLVVSIFVNPSQFAPGEDLDSYPRTFDQDYSILSSVEIEGKKVDVIFAPTVTEMYPSGIDLDTTKQKGAFVSVLGVSEQLEGKTRPNFFRGVATVVTKLFNAVQPDFAYFGQKDIQQTIVLKRMVKDLLLPVEIVVMPIIREDTGLALSSRNTYLSQNTRSKSSMIYKALQAGVNYYNYKKAPVERGEIIRQVTDGLKDPLFKIDYVSVADKEELQELDVVVPGKGAVISTAVYVTENGLTVRLIDNVMLN